MAFDELVRDLRVAARPHRPVTGEVRVGCSGWVYRDWRGPVYPAELPQRALVRAATRRGSTPSSSTPPSTGCPPPTTVERWADAGAAGLRVRGEARPVRLAPHEAARRRAAGCRTTSTECAGSGPRSGPTLVQLPPRWQPQRGAARRVPDRGAPVDLRWAVEVRDPSWLHDDVYEVLARHGAALCIHDLLPHHPWEPHHRLDLRPLPRARRARTRSTTAATAGVGSGAPAERARASGSTTASTSTPTSTTTTTAPRSRTRRGSGDGSGPPLDLVPQPLQRPRVPQRAMRDR